ncbi:MAG: thioredoxin family protein [Methyloceanibacter sp.]
MMSYRALLIAGVIAGAILGSFPALAAEWKPFSQEALAEAQKEGKPILVDIFAAWCPTCRAQKPILEKITAEPRFKDLVVLVVDFDSQKADVRALKAQSQSTLIVYKGPTELGRSAGDTNPNTIAALLSIAL